LGGAADPLGGGAPAEPAANDDPLAAE